MKVTYITPKGNKISIINLWPDVLKYKPIRRLIQVDSINDKSIKFTLNVHYDAHGDGYFEYDNEVIYFKDFEYLSAEKLIEYINNKKKIDGFIDEDKILTTLIKEHNKIRLDFPLQQFETIIPQMGIAITGNKTKNIRCKFVETERYPIHEWHYKITIAPENEDDVLKYSSRTLYFSDLCHMINYDNVELKLN